MYNCPNFSYNFIKNTPYGERKRITYGNGTVTNYDYDVRRRMEHVNHQFPAFNIDKQYVYDPLSNIINIVTDPNSITSPSTGVLGGPVNHTYIYDNYNRLVEAYGHYVGPDDEPSGMLKQDYHLEMAYDLSHNIVSKNQIHQFGSVSTLGQSLPTNAPHAPTSYSLEYGDYAKGVYIADNQGYAQPHAPRVITEYPPDYSQNPDEMRVKKKMIDYDANGNQTEIREQVSDPEEPLGYREVAVRKNLWDEDDRLMGVDLAPENPRDKPLIAAYTYSVDGERAVRYLPGRLDAYYSAKNAGSTDRLEAILYPNSLITVKTLPLPEGLGMDEIERIPLTKYTKHYYIGSERVASALGTVKDLGMLCEQSGFPEPRIINRMNEKIEETTEILYGIYLAFGKNLVLQEPFYYDTRMMLRCDGNHNPDLYAPFWYHPDHLGSSSYITNLAGEINQHMEYLPFGETLVEEHLNSYNSPFKFNAKELDAETGNYYYGARYYDPKWSVWLSVDAEFARFPSYSPYNYTLLNPINLVDPDGNAPAPIKRLLYSKSQGNTGSYTLNNFRFTPASNQSWSGSTTTGSIIQDGRSSLLGRILQSTYGGGEQYTRSVSEITTENKGQYYNVKGEIVDNITDASKVIISKYTKTETVNLYEGGILGNEVTVKESISIQTFDVLKDGNILFSDSFNDSVTKTKDITMASENLQQISTEEASKNKSKFGTQNAQRKANAIMGQMENIYHDAVIESKQDSYGN